MQPHGLSLPLEKGRGVAKQSRYIVLMMGALLVATVVPYGAATVRSASEAATSSDWPMLAHDPARSGSTPREIRPPFVRKWYRLFPDEGLMAGVQPIVAGDTVYVGTLRGFLHAIDEATGQDRWVFRAGGAILHACAVADNKVYFGAADAKVYAVRANDGGVVWTVPTGAAIWNAPVVHAGLVIIGGRDGKLYAIEANSGNIRWAATLGGPLLASPALDVKVARVYAASEDMRVYAIQLDSGQIVWRSPQLPGATFRGYHPVVAPDGSVLVTVAPVMSQDSISPILWDMVKEIFGDIASWRHNKEKNAQLREQNFRLLAQPDTYQRQLNFLRQRLSEQPAYQTYFVLDPSDGNPRFVVPIVYAESMNGTAAPPVVTPEGKVIVKYQVLLRSRYEHYSPFLNVGYLDTKTGHITPIMDQSRTYGWHDSLLLIHDEQSQLVVAGRVLINTHQASVNALDLTTLKGYEAPFATNIHEPQRGEAVGIWTRLLRGQPLPVGKEWLIRGTAIYGGGSAIDVPVSVAGDSFYYIPTHELNSGCALIAYRMLRRGEKVPPVDATLTKPTSAEIDKLRQLPWDWDILQSPRIREFFDPTLAPPGTRATPMEKEAATALARIPDAELDRFIWDVPSRQAPEALRRLTSPADVALRQRLVEAISELIQVDWQPLIFPAGKHPIEAYRFFAEPTETLYTLALAYPHLPPESQKLVREYVARWSKTDGPLDGPTGRSTLDTRHGRRRSFYQLPPEKLWRVVDDIHRTPVARLYPLWLWATVTGDWTHVQRHWNDLKKLAHQPPNKLEEDCRNGYVAGLIAYCRIARHLGDTEAMNIGIKAARQAMRQRLAFELAHPVGGVFSDVPVGRQVVARWRYLTPEVAQLLNRYAGDIPHKLLERYVDYHRPTWYLAWNVELANRNESPFALPTMSMEIFMAKALLANESAARLRQYLDIPWCHADLYYIQKLVYCLTAP